MNALKAAALGLLPVGIGLLAYGAAQGDVDVRLLLVIPLITARGLAPALGILALMAAGVLWVIGSFREAAGEAPPAGPTHSDRAEKPRVRGGGVLLLGPIPIVWGSDKRIVPWLVAGGAILLLLALLLTWGSR